MKVYIGIESASDPLYVKKLQTFALGVKQHGDTVVTDTTQQSMCDVAIIYGSIKKERGRSSHKNKTQIAENFKQYVQIETPLIGRTLNPDLAHFRVGINGFLWNTGNWGHNYIDPNRYNNYFKNFLYPKRETWNTSGDHILMCMQKYGDASLGNLDIYEWCIDTVKKLRQVTNRKIVIRPHPLYRKKIKLDKVKNICLKIPNTAWIDTDYRLYPSRHIDKDLKNAWCTVTYTSGSSVDAVLNGVPNFTLAPGNMAYEVSSHSLDQIENPYRGDKINWLHKLVHCQWSIKEFENGDCWKHIRKSLIV